MSDGPRQSCTWRTRRLHDELSPLPRYRPSASWWATIRDGGAAEVGRPPWAVPPCQELSQSHPGSSSGRRPSHGDGGRPRGAQPNASKNLSASQAEPALGGTLLEQPWSMLSPQLPRVADNSGRSAQRTLDATAGRSTSNSLTSGGRDRELGFNLPPGCREPSRLLAARRWVIEDGPYPPNELGAVAVTCEQSSFPPAVPPTCHKQRSPAVCSGQSRSLREASQAGRPVPDLQ
jgi:hypothetical protein